MVLVDRRRFVFKVVGGLLLACLAYCLIAPNDYEASARIAMRASPAGELISVKEVTRNSASFAPGQNAAGDPGKHPSQRQACVDCHRDPAARSRPGIRRPVGPQVHLIPHRCARTGSAGLSPGAIPAAPLRANAPAHADIADSFSVERSGSIGGGNVNGLIQAYISNTQSRVCVRLPSPQTYSTTNWLV